MSTNPTEAQTRREQIDRQLTQAGWSVERGNVQLEKQLPPTEGRVAEDLGIYNTGEEFADYVLLGTKGLPLAVVEAKRVSRDPLVGQRQVSDYAKKLTLQHGVEPFVFLANGEKIWFQDRAPFPLRPINAFLTPTDLERRAFQRQYVYEPLTDMGINAAIADRAYQLEAGKRVIEALQHGHRSGLLVMATGTGKTRTAVAISDLLLRARWVQRILFLADRRELVRQALGDFKEYLPREPQARIEGGTVDDVATIHFATYPSMMQVYKQLSPGYYDLIIADESHRSIYNHYRVLLEHFDAIKLGLTATPTDYIDHNTFSVFDCPDDEPTFEYSYDKAINEEYLVPYRVFAAQTRFQIEGIKAGQLPPEVQRQIREQGVDLGDIDFAGTDLERRVTNIGTNDALVREFMAQCRKDVSGTLPAKAIIFAMSHLHARELWDSFRRLYPDLHRRGLVEVIDSQMERVDRLLDDFKRKDMPRVAISVDMLDTGIDLPAIQTLVLARPVYSHVKFWQMLGRGTRRWIDPLTGFVKTSFLIIDHWDNFGYFNLHPEGEIAGPTEALPVRLFRLRLEKLVLLQGLGRMQETAVTIAQLRSMLLELPTENPQVAEMATDLSEWYDIAKWEKLDTFGLEKLQKAIAPLLRLSAGLTLPVLAYEIKTERLALAYLKNEDAEIDRLHESIVRDLRLLPTELREIQAEARNLRWMTEEAFWRHLTLDRITGLQQVFAPLMRFRQRVGPDMIHLNLPDQITSRRWIIYGPAGESAFVDSYRGQVEAQIRTLAEDQPALNKIRRHASLTEEDLRALSELLDRPDLFITEDRLREVYERPDAALIDFMRHILGEDLLESRDEQIKAAFDHFITDHPEFTATQITFLRTLRAAVIRRVRLTHADLERPPFSRVGRAQQLFSSDQLAVLLAMADRWAA